MKYKVERIPIFATCEEIESVLNKIASDGWEFAGVWNYAMIFKKNKR